MIIRIDQTSEEPLYLQIRAQIIEGIANGSLAIGDPLPSVRTLAQDLGINLHTVNKAYAVLRDEGYLVMKGRKGASIADPFAQDKAGKAQAEQKKLEESIRALALSAKAHGSTKKEFIALVKKHTDEVFGGNN